MTPAPLKVLWVAKGLGPGGAEHLLVAAASTHDRSVVTIECAYVLPWKDHLAARLEQLDVRTHCLSNRRTDYRWPLHLRRLIHGGHYDIVHLHSPLPGAVARLIVRLMPRSTRPALVCTEHNTWGTHHRLTRWANRLTGRWDQADIAVTDEVRRSMRGPMAARAETLVHGIDVAAVAAQRAHRAEVRAELNIGPDEMVVGTVANFREQKDYPNLLGSARILADRGVAARIVAVGQGPLEGQTRALCTKLGLDDRVVLTGFRADATRLMGACDVFALASKWEGLPVALMEALALGLPIVATNVGGVGETLRDGRDAVLVPPGNAVAMANALEHVLTDPAKRAALASAADARAGEFDVMRAVRRLEQVYSQVATRVEHPASPQAVPAPEPAKPSRRPSIDGLEIRTATTQDRPAILELCRNSLGWGDDDRFEQLFAWKHDQNAFGPSPTWVAVDSGRIVALRAFMRWEFVRGNTVLRAVRAVDTATHPDYQGKGLFTRLTMRGLDEMQGDGVDFVFNSPNAQSRPGYIKMGWQVVGRVPAATHLTRPTAILRTARARTAAEHWSLPVDIGQPAAAWIATGAWKALVHQPADVRELRTRLDDNVLAWRYGGALLHYRAVFDDRSAAIIRVRRRGPATEVVLAQTFGDRTAAARLATGAARQLGADHTIRIGFPDLRHGWAPLPGGGPVLTWRRVNEAAMPPLPNWSLSLGDIELF
ncbi:unannotated protein [freshwater metagenome]|uniref:Unannotated protein n=1 Tax=freshwater metagenome TaxID=449393 RepID=A0A6J7CZ44_9ZZZZ